MNICKVGKSSQVSKTKSLILASMFAIFVSESAFANNERERERE